MRRRFLPTDAFVDESIRGRRYLMGCVLVEAKRCLMSVRRCRSWRWMETGSASIIRVEPSGELAMDVECGGMEPGTIPPTSA